MILFLTPLCFVLGTTVGSFLNVVAYRSVHGGSIFFDSSRCTRCKKKLAARDLVPVVSYFLLGGRCRYCRKPISAQYPFVEAATGILLLLTYLYWLNTEYSIQYTVYSLTDLIYLLFIVSVLVVLFVTDLRDGLLPNSVVLPAIFVVLVYKFLLLFSTSTTISTIATDLLAAFVAASGFFAISYFSKEKAMGGGDAKLVFLIGLAVGWPALLIAVFAAFLTGAFVAVMLILIGKKRFGQTIPFGPFLNLGAFVSLFWGQGIIDLYLRAIIG
jgi:leader peptidase (prepilin peptidase)/N-methyltransferase